MSKFYNLFLLFAMKNSSRNRSLENTIGDRTFFHFLMQFKHTLVEKIIKD